MFGQVYYKEAQILASSNPLATERSENSHSPPPSNSQAMGPLGQEMVQVIYPP